MRSLQVLLSCLVFAVLHSPSGASFMAPRHTSLVGEASAFGHDKNKDMPVTTHNKTKGDGYNAGSPLFKKQEKQAGKNPTPAPKPAAKKSEESTPLGMPDFPKIFNSKESLMDKLKSAGSATLNTFFGTKDHMLQGLSFFCSYFICTLLIALIWIKCTHPGRYEEGENFRDNKPPNFAHGLFAMDHCTGHHGLLCFCAWFCPAIRMADTYAKKPFPLMGGEGGNFWVALIIVAGLMGLTRLTFGFSSAVLFFMAIYYRQQLRKQYELHNGGPSTVWDFLAWSCCTPCAIAQEARQVEFVLKPNDPKKFDKQEVHDHWGVAK